MYSRTCFRMPEVSFRFVFILEIGTLMRKDWSYLLKSALHIKRIHHNAEASSIKTRPCSVLYCNFAGLHFIMLYTHWTLTIGPLVSDIFTNKSLRRIKRIKRMKVHLICSSCSKFIVVGFCFVKLSILRIKYTIIKNNNL